MSVLRHDPQAPGECFTGKLMNDYLPPMYGGEHNKKTTAVFCTLKCPSTTRSTELKTPAHDDPRNGAPYMNWQAMVLSDLEDGGERKG